MSDLISRKEIIDRLERVIQNGVPSEDGMHPISAEMVLEVVRGLSEHGTNLASLGTDCSEFPNNSDAISRQAAIDTVMECYDNDELLMVYVWKLNELPSIKPELQYKTNHGFMWLCPKCGLPIHSDYKRCVRCGHNREKGV